ncbi:hypothetical protein ES332_A11G338500v1 [Gossypium tomentosum]|uniref:Leucine-rich repeat-containing N-terminal plant-type domain-containing protein n=1 Tax=Gossypium tomentosum TaxID=34277 RepID=A0A5D2NIB1_GOSTO|nr:hypothetical protein ES332_A11G338500v1 [Gossypium tomentosum]
MAIATMTTPLPISLFPFFLLIPAFCFTICHANSDVLCIQSERALLKFKNHIIDPSNRLSSWVEGHVNQLHLAPLSEPDDFAPYADHEWEAYYNSLLVGKINPSLLELKHLSSLDLSNNNFSSIQIPKFFGLLESLTYLNLSRARFQGEIPHNLGNLSKLQFLDLGGNDLKSESLQWVSGLSSLQYLDLSSAILSKANDWPVQVTFILPSLLELHLKSCGLEDDPTSISVNSSKSLLALDLFWNRLTSVPKSIFCLHGLLSIDLNYFGNISFLEVLDLSINNLNSSIPNSLYSLNRLQFLSLSDNHLQGKFYSANGNLSSVTHLDLSSNLMLEGRLPTSLEYLCCLDCLESLDMAHNHLFGHLIDQLGHFKNLAHLSLAGNNISGPIPLSTGELSSLKFFDVSENQLNGTFPLCFGQLETLETLDFRYNLLEGAVLETHFSNLTRLTTPNASHNRLTFEPNSSWIPPFQCRIIELGHWHLGPVFPPLLKFQKKLHHSDISYAGISDGMVALYIDTNQLIGEIPDCWNHWKILAYLNLGNDNLTGKIPSTLALLVLKGREDKYGRTLGLLTNMDLSVNNLAREIPKEIGSLVGLLSLNFLMNLLTGNIPDNIGNMELMESLDLSMNRLNGEIPPSFSNLNFLNHFNVSYNNLTRQIPASTQLQSFENLSYVGSHLCGPPLTKNCTSKGTPTDVANNGSNSEGSKVNWLYVSIVLGFVMGFWGVVAPLFLIRSWRTAYY